MSCSIIYFHYLCEKNNLGQIQSIGIYDIVHNNTEAFHFFYSMHSIYSTSSKLSSSWRKGEELESLTLKKRKKSHNSVYVNSYTL